MPEDKRIPAVAAGYMELAGAKKDGDCHKVAVAGGVSLKLGCCNHYEPEDKEKTQEFRCGCCEYKKAKAGGIGAKLVQIGKA